MGAFFMVGETQDRRHKGQISGLSHRAVVPYKTGVNQLYPSPYSERLFRDLGDNESSETGGGRRARAQKEQAEEFLYGSDSPPY